MIESSPSSFDPNDPADLARMRNAAAGMIKNLLAARARSDPDWVEKEEIDRKWFPATQRPNNRSVTYLTGEAAKGFRAFAETFSGPLDSVPCVNETDESPTALVEKLKDLLCQFTNHEELSHAADVFRIGGNSFDWGHYANWGLLPELRTLLNRFPELSEEQRSPHVGTRKLSTVHPSTVTVDGRELQKCPGNTWKLLNFLLKQPKQKCRIQELAEPFLGDHAKKVTNTRIDPIICNANKWLRKNNVPFTVSRVKDVIQLEVSASESDTQP